MLQNNTMAGKAFREFCLIPEICGDGKPCARPGVWKDQAILDGWQARWLARASNVVVASRESYDSGIEIYFPDGSALSLANPGQQAFCAYARVMNEIKEL